MKIYRVSETEWYKANSLEVAIACAMVDTGLSRAELTEGITPKELTEAEMDEMRIATEPPFPGSNSATFRQALDREIAKGDDKPGIFCCKEA